MFSNSVRTRMRVWVSVPTAKRLRTAEELFIFFKSSLLSYRQLNEFCVRRMPHVAHRNGVFVKIVLGEVPLALQPADCVCRIRL